MFAELLRCVLSLQAPVVIHTPHALPMFKEAKQIRKRKSERDHDDAVKFHKPEVGSSAATLGRGAAGLIGKTGGTLLTQYILKNHVSLCTLCPELHIACFGTGFGAWLLELLVAIHASTTQLTGVAWSRNGTAMHLNQYCHMVQYYLPQCSMAQLAKGERTHVAVEPMP